MFSRSTRLLSVLGLLLLGTGLPAVSAAAPDTLVTSGRVVDAFGVAYNETALVTFELENGAGDVRWDEAHTLTFEDGYYAVTLGTLETIDPAILVEDLDIVLTIGATEIGRQALAAVPHALAVDGLVRISANPGVCTSAEHAGTMRWTGSTLQVCDGNSWFAVDVSVPPTEALGGTIVTSGGSTTHTFTASGTFLVGGTAGQIDVEVLGAGGGGGAGNGAFAAGGGGGGYYKGALTVLANTSYVVTIGDLGAGQTACNNALTGDTGDTSSFGLPSVAPLITAFGGAGGGQGGEHGVGGGTSTGAGVTLLVASNGDNGGNASAGEGGDNGGGIAFGAGAPSVPNSTPGNHAAGNGNGGGGGHSCQGNAHRGGGDGSPGIVVITYTNGTL